MAQVKKMAKASVTDLSRKQMNAVHALADKLTAIGAKAGVKVPGTLISFDSGTSEKTRVFFTRVAESKMDGSYQKSGHLWRFKDGTYGQLCISPRAATAEELESKRFYIWFTLGLCLASAEADGERGSNKAYINPSIRKRLSAFGINAVFPDAKTGVMEKATGKMYEGEYSVLKDTPMAKFLANVPESCQLPAFAEMYDHRDKSVLGEKPKSKWRYTLNFKSGDADKSINLFGIGGQVAALESILADGVEVDPEITDAEFKAKYSNAPAAGESTGITAKGGATGTAKKPMPVPERQKTDAETVDAIAEAVVQ